jgi:hypothetical protein
MFTGTAFGARLRAKEVEPQRHRGTEKTKTENINSRSRRGTEGRDFCFSCGPFSSSVCCLLCASVSLWFQFFV